MALGAGGLGNTGGMRERLMVFMAVRAGESGMHRACDLFCLVVALCAADLDGAVRMPDRDQRKENHPKGKRKKFPFHGIGGPKSFLQERFNAGESLSGRYYYSTFMVLSFSAIDRGGPGRMETVTRNPHPT